MPLHVCVCVSLPSSNSAPLAGALVHSAVMSMQALDL